MTDIATLRRQALGARRALTPDQTTHASQRAARRMARLPRVARARRIGLYWPLASEADPRWLAHRLADEVDYFFPRVAADTLVFVPVTDPLDRSGWPQSALGVFEPPGRGLPIEALDVLIMPLAGFDVDANRIGLGGGFYDRSLAAIAGRGYRRPHFYGLAGEAQRVARFTPQPWDIALDAVITERAVYRRGTR